MLILFCLSASGIKENAGQAKSLPAFFVFKIFCISFLLLDNNFLSCVANLNHVNALSQVRQIHA